MLQAILKGKLSREEERMEDLLTSCVFGILKYTSPDQFLIPFLRLARNPVTYESIGPILRDNSTVESVEFWPYLKSGGCHPCEPDVDCTIRSNDGARARIFIEAKYHSRLEFGNLGSDRAGCAVIKASGRKSGRLLRLKRCFGGRKRRFNPNERAVGENKFLFNGNCQILSGILSGIIPDRIPDISISNFGSDYGGAMGRILIINAVIHLTQVRSIRRLGQDQIEFLCC